MPSSPADPGTLPGALATVRILARREIGLAVGTPMGWVLAAGFWAVAGLLFVAQLDAYVLAGHEQLAVPWSATRLSLAEHLLIPWFGNLTVLTLVVVPALAMRTLADEQRRGSLELLLTSPITTAQIVAGKFVGNLVVAWVLVGATAWMPASLWLFSAPDPGVVLGGYLALALVIAALLALGLLASSATDQPIVAMMLAFAGGLGLYVVGWLDPDPTSLASRLSMAEHTLDLLRGGLRLSDVAYFVSVVGWALFAAHQRLEAHRYA